METVILTWLWKQTRTRAVYTAEHVNAWARAIRENVTGKVDIACVTDMPEGIDESVRIIKPPGDFMNISVQNWSELSGKPQCYRRLSMFRPDAAEVFGADKIICMDLDVIITGNIDHIVNMDVDFAICRGTVSKRPYNGSLMIIRAGARPQVFTDFDRKKAVEASSKYAGSDQAWLAVCLGPNERTIGPDDGVYAYGPSFVRKYAPHGAEKFEPPENMKILFFPGIVKVFLNNAQHALDRDKIIARACMKHSPVYLVQMATFRRRKGGKVILAKIGSDKFHRLLRNKLEWERIPENESCRIQQSDMSPKRTSKNTRRRVA